MKNFGTIFISQLCTDLTLFLNVLVFIIAEILHVLGAIAIVCKHSGLIFKILLRVVAANLTILEDLPRHMVLPKGLLL